MMCTGRIDHNCDNLITARIDDIEKEVEKQLTEILDHCEDKPIEVEVKGFICRRKN